MQQTQFILNRTFTFDHQAGGTVQAGTPMTVTANGIPLWMKGRDVIIFCLKISSGGGDALRRRGGQTAPLVGHGLGVWP